MNVLLYLGVQPAVTDAETAAKLVELMPNIKFVTSRYEQADKVYRDTWYDAPGKFKLECPAPDINPEKEDGE